LCISVLVEFESNGFAGQAFIFTCGYYYRKNVGMLKFCVRVYKIATKSYYTRSVRFSRGFQAFNVIISIYS
jgi:hypothetical protein